MLVPDTQLRREVVGVEHTLIQTPVSQADEPIPDRQVAQYLNRLAVAPATHSTPYSLDVSMNPMFLFPLVSLSPA